MPGKLYGTDIADRVESDEQCGFWKGRGCIYGANC